MVSTKRDIFQRILELQRNLNAKGRSAQSLKRLYSCKTEAQLNRFAWPPEQYHQAAELICLLELYGRLYGEFAGEKLPPWPLTAEQAASLALDVAVFRSGALSYRARRWVDPSAKLISTFARAQPYIEVGMRTMEQKAEWSRKGQQVKKDAAKKNHNRWEVEARKIIAERKTRIPSYRELARQIAEVTCDKPETIRKYIASLKILGK